MMFNPCSLICYLGIDCAGEGPDYTFSKGLCSIDFEVELI